MNFADYGVVGIIVVWVIKEIVKHKSKTELQEQKSKSDNTNKELEQTRQNLLDARLKKIEGDLSDAQEKLKADLDKDKYKHQLRFEKQFKEYEELWKDASNLPDEVITQRGNSLDDKLREIHRSAGQTPHDFFCFMLEIKGSILTSKWHSPYIKEHIYHQLCSIVNSMVTGAKLQPGLVSDDVEIYNTFAPEYNRKLNEELKKLSHLIREEIMDEDYNTKTKTQSSL